jgi:DNA polymerase-3 subunit alpha
MAKILVADTETTGLWNKNADYKDPSQPHIVQLAAQIYNDKREVINELNVIIKPEGYEIPKAASDIHGVTTEMAMEYGINRKAALQLFVSMLQTVGLQVGHNYRDYDINVLKANIFRVSPNGEEAIKLLGRVAVADTMHLTTNLCKLPGKYGAFKWPKLQETHKFLFGKEFEDAHSALGDIEACGRCYFELVDRKLI